MSDVTADNAASPVDRPSLLRSSGLVAMGTALSRLTGFLRLAAMGYAIGVTALSDTYTLANNTPNIVYELLLGGVLSATLVPIFVHHSHEGDDEATSAVITVALAALVAITVVGILAAPWIVRLYTLTASQSVAGEQRAVATSMLRLLMPQMLFYGATAMGTALLNARRRFAAPAFTPVLNNVLVIAMFLALPHIAGRTPTLRQVGSDHGLLMLMGLGTTAGIVAMTVALLPSIRRSSFRFRPTFAIRHPAVREVGRMSGWTVGYVLANQAALLMVLLLANRRVGGPTSYTWAYTFFLLPYALVAVSLMTTIVPELATAATMQDRRAFRERFSFGLRLMGLVILPAATGYVVLAQPIVHSLIKYGQVSAKSAELVGDNLAMFGLGLFGYALYLYTLRAFYALRDTKTPFFLNLLENGINVVMAFALEPVLGVPGLALSYAVAYTVAGAVALLALRRRVGRLAAARTLRTLVRITLACLVMAGVVAVAIRVVGGPYLLQTAVGVVLGVAVFVTVVSRLHITEVAALRSRVLRRS